jgi:hypothetical protein
VNALLARAVRGDELRATSRVAGLTMSFSDDCPHVSILVKHGKPLAVVEKQEPENLASRTTR